MTNNNEVLIREIEFERGRASVVLEMADLVLEYSEVVMCQIEERSANLVAEREEAQAVLRSAGLL